MTSETVHGTSEAVRELASQQRQPPKRRQASKNSRQLDSFARLTELAPQERATRSRQVIGRPETEHARGRHPDTEAVA